MGPDVDAQIPPAQIPPADITLAAPAEGDEVVVLPGDLDYHGLLADLDAQNVAAEQARVPGLQAVVARARDDGYDVHLVVVEETLPVFTQYRDVAAELQSETGGTVIVLGPNAVGSSSAEFSRVDLENATADLPLADPAQAAEQMYDEMTAPAVDWTLVTIVLILVVAIGAVLGRIRGLRRAPVAESTDASADAGSSSSADAGQETSATSGNDRSGGQTGG